MDDLAQHIAGQVGRRWVQLYSRLGLGPRERYRFECSHQDKQEEDKWRSCALDTLSCWRATVAELDESLAITQLLTALRKVAGFEELANELAQSHGIALEPQPTPRAQEPELSPLSTPPITIRRLPSSTQPTDPLKVEETTVTESPTSTQHLEDSGNSFMSDCEPMTSPLTCSDTTESLSGLLHCAVNLRNSTHKFAILDVSQRLGADRWSAIARKLCLQEEDIQEIQTTESCVEERYYKMLKQWVKSRQDEATFAALRHALTSCNQTAAVGVVLRRLETHGPTL